MRKYINIIKHAINKVIILCSILCIGYSCNNFLNTEPYASISETKAITNYNNAVYALTGTYNSLQSTSYYGRNYVVFGDSPTDNIIISPNNSNRFIAQGQWSVGASNADILNIWYKGYQAIDQANKILALVDNIDASASEIALVKAQALAIRALVHFDLVKYFAQSYSGNSAMEGIPYMLQSSTYDKPARNTIAEVYDYIIADLTNSISTFGQVNASDLSSATTVNAPYYITEWSAKAILAKVYISQLNYTAAMPVLSDIINNSGFQLLSASKYVEAWSLSYDNSSGVEFMFAIRNLSDDYGATNCLGYIYVQSGYGDLRVPATMQSLYTDTDIRRQVLFAAGTGTQTEWTFVNKYPGRDGTIALSDIPVIRLSDIYLMYAEALTASNASNIPTAIPYLDAIRLRADASAAATPTTISQTDMLNTIYLERRKELAYEGHYFFDLKRLQMTINSAYRSDNTLYTTITYPNDLLAMPIPQSEIDANPNINQNPGY